MSKNFYDIFENTLREEGSLSYVCREYSNKLAFNLNALREEGRLCDVDLISGDRVVKAHRVVLSASCAYFDAMFNGGLEESQKNTIKLQSIPPDILPMIIDFIYTGKVEIDKNTVQHLLIAADMLQLRELVTGCGEYLRRELHPTNALGIYRFAEAHNCSVLAHEAQEHVEAHWVVVAAGEEFVDLPLEQLIVFLSSENLKVDREEQVLAAALRWLDHDPVSRRRYCFEVLSSVRLPLISPQVIDDAIEALQDPSVQVALRTVRRDMKSGRGALVPLAAEPRASARRVLILAGGSTLDVKGDDILASVLKFDMTKRQWEEMAPMGIARIQPGVATLSGRVYAVGGEQGSQILANGEMYDPQTEKWTNIAAMNQARCEFGLTGWNGRLLAFGGWVGSDMGASVEMYDPANDEWTLIGPMPEARFGMGVVNYEGLIYIVGGCTHARRHTRDLLCYWPATQQWRTLSPMRRRRSQAAAVVMGAHLYVLGGNAPKHTVLSSVERYSFRTDTWEEVTPMMEARAGLAAAAADGVLLVAGGDSEAGAAERGFYRERTMLRTVELHERGAWRAGPLLPVARAEAGATLL